MNHPHTTTTTDKIAVIFHSRDNGESQKQHTICGKRVVFRRDQVSGEMVWWANPTDPTDQKVLDWIAAHWVPKPNQPNPPGAWARIVTDGNIGGDGVARMQRVFTDMRPEDFENWLTTNSTNESALEVAVDVLFGLNMPERSEKAETRLADLRKRRQLIGKQPGQQTPAAETSPPPTPPSPQPPTTTTEQTEPEQQQQQQQQQFDPVLLLQEGHTRQEIEAIRGGKFTSAEWKQIKQQADHSSQPGG